LQLQQKQQKEAKEKVHNSTKEEVLA